MSNRVKNNVYYIIVSALFGVFATFYTYSQYGSQDQVEQLPLIFRCMDSNYLQNDFFINEGSISVARMYFSKLIAFVAGTKANLPYVLFLLTVLSNISISVITYLFARRLFNNSGSSGIFAAAAVMLVSTFTLGWNNTIYQDILLPSSISLPLLFGAIWAVAEKRVITCAVLCAVASFIHPLMGLEMSSLLLFVFVVVQMVNKEPVKQYIVPLSIGVVILAISSAVLLYNEIGGAKLDTERFIHIIACFRHPHHYLPSTFAGEDYLHALLFLLAAIPVFFFSIPKNRNFRLVTAVITATLLLLCIGGYVFVEVIPTRLWTTAQVFRLLFFVKWLGLIVLAGSIPAYKLRGINNLFHLLSLVNPVTTLWAVYTRVIISKLRGRFSKSIIHTVVLSIMLWWMIWMELKVNVAYIILILVCVDIAEGYNRWFITRVALPSMFVFAMFIILTQNRIFYSNRYVYRTMYDIREARDLYFVMPLADMEGGRIMAYIREKTKKDVVFLTPPMWGQFRMAAERAIVVDFKSFPFTDKGIEEWYDRMLNCYGTPVHDGFEMTRELQENYKNIDDKKLKELKGKYNISYALLYNQTPTTSDVVYIDDKFKLVRVP